MSKRAVILAGGVGSRLHPYTIVLPKPLMPIGNYPILEIVVRQLSSYGFSHITMAVNHQAEIIKAYFGDGSKWDIFIDYSLEDLPLSTMAPLRLIKDLPDTFLVMNGDVLTDLDFSKFYTYHQGKKNLLTISTCVREQQSEFGVLEISKNQTLSGFQEKPVFKYEVSMGIYMLSKKILDFIPDDQAFGFDHLIHKLLKAKIKTHTLRHENYWLDIGRPDDYLAAQKFFKNNECLFLNDTVTKLN